MEDNNNPNQMNNNGFYTNPNNSNNIANSTIDNKKEKKPKKHRFLKVLFVLLIIVILLGCIGYFGIYFYLKNTVKTVEINTTNLGIKKETEKTLEEYTNIAILGIDAMSDTYYETEPENAKHINRTDCIIIASINNKTNDVQIFSIYRDTYVQMDLYGKTILNKINHAYYEGVENTLKTINTNLDLNIKDYVLANYNAISDLIDEVDGVEIDLTSEELKYINGYVNAVNKATGKNSPYVKRAGTQTLNGVQATSYCRIRYTAGKDYKRTERMRLVLEKVIEKLKTKNIAELTSIANKILPRFNTNIPTNKMMAILPRFFTMKITNQFGWPYKTTGVTIDGDYMGPAITLESNVKKLHQELFNNPDYVVPQSVVDISNKIIDKTGLGG